MACTARGNWWYWFWSEHALPKTGNEEFGGTLIAGAAGNTAPPERFAAWRAGLTNNKKCHLARGL